MNDMPLDAQFALLALEATDRPDVMTVIFDLARGSKIGPVQLTLDDPTLDYSVAEGLAAAIGAIKRSSSWWLGDLLAFGEAAYGEQFAQLEVATGLSQETLLDHLSVAKSVSPKVREPGVAWGCHKLVRRLPPAEQKAWLREARKGGLTVDELRKRMQAKRREDAPQLPDTGSGSDPGGVFEVARAILRDAREADDPAYFLIPREDMERLKAALGET